MPACHSADGDAAVSATRREDGREYVRERDIGLVSSYSADVNQALICSSVTLLDKERGTPNGLFPIEMISNAASFIIAGADTTATVLSVTTYSYSGIQLRCRYYQRDSVDLQGRVRHYP